MVIVIIAASEFLQRRLHLRQINKVSDPLQELFGLIIAKLHSVLTAVEVNDAADVVRLGGRQGLIVHRDRLTGNAASLSVRVRTRNPAGLNHTWSLSLPQYP